MNTRAPAGKVQEFTVQGFAGALGLFMADVVGRLVGPDLAVTAEPVVLIGTVGLVAIAASWARDQMA